MIDGGWDFLADITWIGAEEGGRSTGPPSGGSYFPTVVLIDAWRQSVPGDHFSVEFKFVDYKEGHPRTALGRFFFVDLVRDRLRAGLVLAVMEGPRRVGCAEISQLHPSVGGAIT